MASDGLRKRLADQLDGLGCGCDQPAGRLADAALTVVAAWLRDEAAKLRRTAAHWRGAAKNGFAAPEELARRRDACTRCLAQAVALEALARSLDGEQTTEGE